MRWLAYHRHGETFNKISPLALWQSRAYHAYRNRTWLNSFQFLHTHALPGCTTLLKTRADRVSQIYLRCLPEVKRLKRGRSFASSRSSLHDRREMITGENPHVSYSAWISCPIK